MVLETRWIGCLERFDNTMSASLELHQSSSPQLWEGLPSASCVLLRVDFGTKFLPESIEILHLLRFSIVVFKRMAVVCHRT